MFFSFVGGVDRFLVFFFVGFIGQNCEENIDDCLGNSCKNGGVCVDGVNIYNCRCLSEWIGMYRGGGLGRDVIEGEEGVVVRVLRIQVKSEDVIWQFFCLRLEFEVFILVVIIDVVLVGLCRSFVVWRRVVLCQNQVFRFESSSLGRIQVLFVGDDRRVWILVNRGLELEQRGGSLFWCRGCRGRSDLVGRYVEEFIQEVFLVEVDFVFRGVRVLVCG